ncbi:hypothetical protein U9M48_044555 [Paspalum notatum var. saurae]|uniref:Uncharacterized protein n=1 Tax=Paspalum notatum var. saurae TaxID=547442 RepID=A0AAQ3UVY5_PASNO
MPAGCRPSPPHRGGRGRHWLAGLAGVARAQEQQPHRSPHRPAGAGTSVGHGPRAHVRSQGPGAVGVGSCRSFWEGDADAPRELVDRDVPPARAAALQQGQARTDDDSTTRPPGGRGGDVVGLRPPMWPAEGVEVERRLFFWPSAVRRVLCWGHGEF